jgi:hypothetical protein
MAQRVVNFRGGEQIVIPWTLDRIITSHNPRRPIRRLQRQGHVPLELVHNLALSDDPAKNAEYVTLMTQEPAIESLARSIKGIGQCQPIILRTYRAAVGKEPATQAGEKAKIIYDQRGGIAAGERRILAVALLEAQRRIAVSKGETPNQDKPWTVDAIGWDMTVETASQIGWDENDQREQMTDLDYGERFDAKLREYNPLTQRPYTIQEVADLFGKNYHWVRGRAALPYLPIEHQQQVEDQTCNITEACNLALRYKAKALAGEQEQADQVREGKGAAPAVPDQGVSDQPTQPQPATGTESEALPGRRARRATLALADVQALFDATPEANTERRQAFAEVMGLALEQASKDSITRKEAKEAKDAKAAERRARKGAAA